MSTLKVKHMHDKLKLIPKSERNEEYYVSFDGTRAGGWAKTG